MKAKRILSLVMATNLRSVFVTLLLMIVLSGCSTGESSPKALEGDTIPID